MQNTELNIFRLMPYIFVIYALSNYISEIQFIALEFCRSRNDMLPFDDVRFCLVTQPYLFQIVVLTT
jgi:hypothetical protein